MLKTLLKLSLLFRRCRKSELKVDENLLNQNVDSIENSAGRAIKQYENHPSIKGIERNVESRIFFSVLNFLFVLNKNRKNWIPRRLLRTRIFQQESWKKTLTFLLNLFWKINVYKKGSGTKPYNRQSVIILSNLSKVNKRCLG